MKEIPFNCSALACPVVDWEHTLHTVLPIILAAFTETAKPRVRDLGVSHSSHGIVAGNSSCS